jgi:hypothetical protein
VHCLRLRECGLTRPPLKARGIAAVIRNSSGSAELHPVMMPFVRFELHSALYLFRGGAKASPSGQT